MAFEIVLQRNNSETYKVDKDLSAILTVTGTLKDSTSIITPIILIECNLSSVVSCNYMTIASFGRKYFVENIRSMRNGLVEFTCRVDVLSTYAAGIRGCKAIVRKQQNDWNLYLNDGSFRVYQNPIVATKAFPSGFTTQEFVLAVAGG